MPVFRKTTHVILSVELILMLFSFGESIQQPQTSCSCQAGVPGLPGKPGDQGPAGRDGRDGVNGLHGVPGQPGRDGRDGTQCSVGSKRERGPPGPASIAANWKECVWRKEDSKDIGKIMDCMFVKINSSTALRVFFAGHLAVNDPNACCKRWYFTFNGAECNGPMAIEGVIWVWKRSGSEQIYRHRHIEGHCLNIPKGKVRVGFWVGNCQGYGNADASTGWNSVSRIYVEEVPPPQN